MRSSCPTRRAAGSGIGSVKDRLRVTPPSGDAPEALRVLDEDLAVEDGEPPIVVTGPRPPRFGEVRQLPFCGQTKGHSLLGER